MVIQNIDKSISEVLRAYIIKHKSMNSCLTSSDDSVLKPWAEIVLPLKGILHNYIV